MSESVSARREIDSAPDQAENLVKPSESEKVTIQGEIVVVDAQGVEHRAKDGSFRPRFYREIRVLSWEGSLGPPVEVTAGRFKVKMKANDHLGFTDLILGGRAAVVGEEMHYPVDSEEVLEVRASWLTSPLLHVVDASSGVPLSPLEVLIGSDWNRHDNPHPGELLRSAVKPSAASSPLTPRILSGASSPVRLDPLEICYSPSSHDSARVPLWVRSPGYAWIAARADLSVDKERTIALQPAAELSITLVNRPQPTKGGKGQEGGPKLRIRSSPSSVEANENEAVEIIRKIEREKPGKDDAVLTDWRTHLYRLRENPQLEGRVLMEQNLGEIEGPIVITGLDAGQVTATVEVGDWWEDNRAILGWATVDLKAGRRSHAIVDLKPLPELDPPALLAGTLFLPPAWGKVLLSMTLKPMDIPGASADDSIRIDLSKMKPVPEKEGLYRWSAGLVVPGRFETEIDPFHLMQVIRVPVTGLLDAHIDIGEPIAVVVHVLEGDTGKPVVPGSSWNVSWHPEYPEEISGGSFEGAEYDKEIEGYRFVAPAGRVELGCHSDGPYWSQRQSYEINAEAAEITVHLERACGIIVLVQEDGRSLSFDSIKEQFHIDGYEGEVDLFLPNGRIDDLLPGDYVIRIDPIDGFEPIDPTPIHVPKSKFVEHVVTLERIE